jgi:hypothetical protein
LFKTREIGRTPFTLHNSTLITFGFLQRGANQTIYTDSKHIYGTIILHRLIDNPIRHCPFLPFVSTQIIIASLSTRPFADTEDGAVENIITIDHYSQFANFLSYRHRVSVNTAVR